MIFKKSKHPQIVFAFADNTANLYEIPPNDYKRLLHENVTKKSTKHLENPIHIVVIHIAKNVKLDDCIESGSNTNICNS